MHRVVLVGCGLMADGWLEAIQSTPRLKASVSVVGLVDLDVNRAKDLAGRFGLATAICGSSLDAVIEATKPDMLFDIVVPPARAQVVKTGLRAGCHVLSEKPMAMSLEEGRELIAAAKQAGRIHAIIQNRRYIPGIRRLRRAIERGLSARSRPCTPISSSAHISAASAKRWTCAAARHGDPYDGCCPLHDRHKAARRLLPRDQSQGFLVSARGGSKCDLRVRRWRGVHLSRVLVRGRCQYQLGEPLADRRVERHDAVGRSR